MHQYELMRLLARMAAILAETTRTAEADALAIEANALVAEWNAEEREYIDAATRSADGE